MEKRKPPQWYVSPEDVLKCFYQDSEGPSIVKVLGVPFSDRLLRIYFPLLNSEGWGAPVNINEMFNYAFEIIDQEIKSEVELKIDIVDLVNTLKNLMYLQTQNLQEDLALPMYILTSYLSNVEMFHRFLIRANSQQLLLYVLQNTQDYDFAEDLVGARPHGWSTDKIGPISKIMFPLYVEILSVDTRKKLAVILRDKIQKGEATPNENANLQYLNIKLSSPNRSVDDILGSFNRGGDDVDMV